MRQELNTTVLLLLAMLELGLELHCLGLGLGLGLELEPAREELGWLVPEQGLEQVPG